MDFKQTIFLFYCNNVWTKDKVSYIALRADFCHNMQISGLANKSHCHSAHTESDSLLFLIMIQIECVNLVALDEIQDSKLTRLLKAESRAEKKELHVYG